MKNFIKKNWHYIMALMIPVIIILIHAYWKKVLMFGSGSILVGDSMVQILPVYYELWDKIHSGASLSYTWNIGGGLDFYSLLGYVMSPFTLFMLIVPRKMVSTMLECIILSKWVLTSLSATLFFYKTRFNTLTERKRLVSLFLGLAFCLSNGIVYYMGYPQLMDPIICFPILLLLIEKMYDEKKWKLYYIVLSFSMITSIYVSYIISIFLCIWFVFLYEKKYKPDIKKIFFRFSGTSVIAAITAIVSAVQLLDAGSGRLANNGVRAERIYFAKTLLIKFHEFLNQFFVMTPLAKSYSVLPNIYISVLAVLLVPFLLFIKMEKQKKIKMISLLLLMIISLFWGAWNLVWHGFTVPNGVYHRHIFIIIIVLLLGTLQVMCHLQDLTVKSVILIGVVEVALFVYAFFKVKVYDSFVTYYLTALLLCLGEILLFLFARKSIQYKRMLSIICLIGIAELCANAVNAMDYYRSIPAGSLSIYGTSELYKDSMDMKPGERMVSLYSYNYGAVFNRPSGEGFASSIHQGNLNLHEKLGLAHLGRVQYSDLGGSPLINLMYNNRYGVSYHESSFSDVEEVEQNSGTSLYRMKRLAGLGYMVNSDIVNWDINDATCFDVQNQFVDLAVNGKPFFKVLDVDLETKNVDDEGLVFAKTDNKEYSIYADSKYASIYDSIQAEFTVDHDMDLYIYTVGDYNGTDYFNYYIYVDGEQRDEDFRGALSQTIHVGNVKKGQKVSIVRMPTVHSSYGNQSSWGLVFGEFDEEAYNESYEKLSKNTYDISVFEDDYVKGTIHADEDGIMMTSILADDNFTVYVDGDKVSYETIGDTMIGVPLSKGDHTVEFKYKNDVLKKGLVGSGVGFLLFVLVCIIEKIVAKHKKTEDNENTDEYTESDEVMLENLENIQDDEVTQEIKSDMEKVQEEDHPEELEEEIQE